MKKFKKLNKLSLKEISSEYKTKHIIGSNGPCVFIEEIFQLEDVDGSKAFRISHLKKHGEYHNWIDQEGMIFSFEYLWKRESLKELSRKFYFMYSLVDKSYCKNLTLRVK